MPYLTTIPESRVYSQVTEEFRGYNHNLRINDGEFWDEKNVSSDYYPLFANRRKRSVAYSPTNPLGILGRAQLAYIDGANLYYNGLNVTSYLTAAGVAISTSAGMQPKRLVNFGAYICIFPDKIYINVETIPTAAAWKPPSAAPATSPIPSAKLTARHIRPQPSVLRRQRTRTMATFG